MNLNPVKAYKLYAARRRYQPNRESQAYPKILGVLGRSNSLLGTTQKVTPTNLRAFSRTPYARRAINAIKNPIVALPWRIVADNENAHTLAQVETLTRCFQQPNVADMDRSFFEQIIEDICVAGAGVFEIGLSGDKARPLWMWPVDTTTIKPLAQWTGDPRATRFIQSTGYVGGSLLGKIDTRELAAQDICYMRVNASSESPEGYGPLEIAYMSIQRQLGVGSYAASLATNAQPQNIIYAGDLSQEEIETFRQFLTNEVEGRGKTPLLGGKVKPDVLRLHPGGDEAMYLKYQMFLIREIATAFGISAQNLNLEADVNRNTSEVAEDRDWDSAIVPMARLIETHINRDVIQGRLGMAGVRFMFEGVDREDEQAAAEIFKIWYESNAIVPDEFREQRGLKPLGSMWGTMTWADVQIAMAAARGSAQVDDPELPKPATPKPAKGKPKPGDK